MGNSPNNRFGFCFFMLLLICSNDPPNCMLVLFAGFFTIRYHLNEIVVIPPDFFIVTFLPDFLPKSAITFATCSLCFLVKGFSGIIVFATVNSLPSGYALPFHPALNVISFFTIRYPLSSIIVIIRPTYI